MSEALRTDDLTIIQGSDGGWFWPIVDANGDSIPDVTGYEGAAQVRSNVKSDEVLAEFTTANGGIEFEIMILNGQPTSVVKLLYTHAATSAYTWTKGVYDLEVTAPLGGKTRVVEGKMKVDPEVTR